MMAHEAEGLMCEDMATFTWEKSWIWHRPVPAWPMTWPAMVSGTARVTVMQGSFTEGIWLIACWGWHVGAGIVQDSCGDEEGWSKEFSRGQG